jgi:hypothetical protein
VAGDDIESTDKGAGSSALPWDDGPHAIILTDEASPGVHNKH